MLSGGTLSDASKGLGRWIPLFAGEIELVEKRDGPATVAFRDDPR